MKAIQKTESKHRLSTRLILARLEIVYRPEERSHILNNFFVGFDPSDKLGTHKILFTLQGPDMRLNR